MHRTSVSSAALFVTLVAAFMQSFTVCCEGEKLFEVDLTTGVYDISSDSGMSWSYPGSGLVSGSTTTSCAMQGVLRIDFPHPIPQCKRPLLRFDMYLSPDAFDFNFNIGDSSNNGWGGDAGHTSNAAEVHNRHQNWYIYTNTLPGYADYTVSGLNVESDPPQTSLQIT